jgi:hypothetical protein
MLKFLFWSLVLANAGLFAYQRGYLGTWHFDGREPARMAQQFNADKMKPIPAGAIVSSSATADAAVAKPEVPACTEIGNFDAVTAKLFELKLLPLALGDKLSRRAVQEAARNMVYIPSQGSKEGADKKAAELRRLGVNDFYIMQDAGEMHWGISLGIFKTDEGARAQLTALTQKGVHSARLGTYNLATANKVIFQLRNLDANANAALAKITLEFPPAETRGCEPNPVAEKQAVVTPPLKETYPRDAIH